MRPTSLLIGQIALSVAILLIGTWSATQWAAASLGYQQRQQRLGTPWFKIHTLPVYHPWQLFEWWYLYDRYAENVFNKAGVLVAGSGLPATAAAIAGSLWRARQSQLITTYGSARWATTREIRHAGLTATDDGVFLGRIGEQYLRHAGPEYVMAYAPTRSGKGVGLVVPTLLTWPHSTVIHDIKGENWQLTAGWRSPADWKKAFWKRMAGEVSGRGVPNVRLWRPYVS